MRGLTEHSPGYLRARQTSGPNDSGSRRLVKLESGEHNPDIGTIINAVRQLGIEFCLDVAPAKRKPVLVSARARKHEAIDHDEVSVVAASSPS